MAVSGVSGEGIMVGEVSGGRRPSRAVAACADDATSNANPNTLVSHTSLRSHAAAVVNDKSKPLGTLLGLTAQLLGRCEPGAILAHDLAGAGSTSWTWSTA